MMKYYDATTGTERFKRRYIWAGWALFAGIVIGVLAGKIF